MPFRAERLERFKYGFRGYKNNFPTLGRAVTTVPIETAEDLFGHMKSWTRAPVEEISVCVRQAGGCLAIKENMLAVEIEEGELSELNERLSKMEAEIGLPEKIDPNFDDRKKAGLWEKIYGQRH